MPAVAPRRPSAPASSPEGEAATAQTPPFRWTRERYDQAVDAGVFGPDDKVELIDGQIVPKMPQNRPHRVATTLTAQALRSAFGVGFFVQEEKPIALSALSEPEPDVAVIMGSPRDYDPHPDPSGIVLLVEAADSSLGKDRTRMNALYAEAGISEYWIVNLREQILEVHRDPAGGAYRTKVTFAAGEFVTPLGASDTSISVADLLP